MIYRTSPYPEQSLGNSHTKKVNKIVKNILKLFNKTPKNQRYSILSIVSSEISKKDLRKTGFVFSNTMYNTSKRKLTEDTIEERIYSQPKSKKSKNNDVTDLINEYLIKNSELTCKIHKNEAVFNLQRSKRYIYKQLINEHPEIELSISTYYKLCPKKFKYIKKKTDMCDICFNGSKLVKKLGDTSLDKRVKYYKEHLELNQDQKAHFKNKLNNLHGEECVVVMDFKQNFKVGGGPVETSQCYYNKSSVSCLGFCVITRDEYGLKRSYHNYLSEIISHDSYFVKKLCIRAGD